MNVTKSSDWLISENKAGNKKYWRLHMIQDGDKYYTQTHWYQMTATGKASKEQFSDPYYAAPTNEGRANERNSRQQAEFEFDAIVKKQKDRGYRAEGEKAQERPMPMLAHKFKDHPTKVQWPCFVQPKLNGMRMLFDGEHGWSRGNKEIIPEVIQHLKFDTNGFTLDGELILPNNVLLQETMKAAKKYRPELSPLLEYHVYDVVDSTLPYAKRYQLIVDLLPTAPANVKLVMTDSVTNEAEVLKSHKMFVQQGYEGTMIRNPSMTYEIGKRSYSLLKLKDFVDDEFQIIGFEEGNGSFEKSIIFICDANGKSFNVVPEGTMEHKQELWSIRDTLLNKWLIVRYFEKSNDGIPIFPVGVSIREIGDF